MRRGRKPRSARQLSPLVFTPLLSPPLGNQVPGNLLEDVPGFGAIQSISVTRACVRASHDVGREPRRCGGGCGHGDPEGVPGVSPVQRHVPLSGHGGTRAPAPASIAPVARAFSFVPPRPPSASPHGLHSRAHPAFPRFENPPRPARADGVSAHVLPRVHREGGAAGQALERVPECAIALGNNPRGEKLFATAQASLVDKIGRRGTSGGNRASGGADAAAVQWRRV